MSTNTSNDAAFGAALIAECRRRILGKCGPRIERCLNTLSEEEIWLRPNGAVVSVGNLVLHLCGNARQWVCAVLGGAPDDRVREREFSAESVCSRAELLALLAETLDAVGRTLDGLDPAGLLEPRYPQGQEETGFSILVNTIEHFGYHTGQITLHVKLLKGIDLRYAPGPGLRG